LHSDAKVTGMFEILADGTNLVPILTTFDPVKVSISKSILESAGIWYYAKGDRLQNMPFSYLSGPVEIVVRQQDVEVALELLRELDEE